MYAIRKMDVSGQIQNIPEVDQKIIEALDEWDASLAENSSWLAKNKSKIVEMVLFLIRWTDILIQEVENKIQSGADKKATVIYAIGLLIDYASKEALPFYLKPFSSLIKGFTISSIITTLIDFMVNKYNDGSWNFNKEDTNGKEATT